MPYSDDPRNTNEAWVETSAWHVHCPADQADELDLHYHHTSRQVMWMDIQVVNGRLEFQDSEHNRYDLFASHRELIELAVFGNVLGNHDMPFEYNGEASLNNGSEFACLNPNHSHYICVDDGSKGKFGVEVNFRVELETFISCYDYDARRMGIEALTQHFTCCMDQSALHIAGEACITGVKSSAIALEEGSRPTLIPVSRVASNGSSRWTGTVKVIKDDSAAYDADLQRQMSRQRTPSPDPTDQTASPFSLEGNDVRAISISDGGLDFFPAAPFNPLASEYEIRVPSSVASISATVTLAAGRPKDIKLTVPIVILGYGGGPLTIKTLAGSGEHPIIIVRGSLRSAQFIEVRSLGTPACNTHTPLSRGDDRKK